MCNPQYQLSNEQSELSNWHWGYHLTRGKSLKATPSFC